MALHLMNRGESLRSRVVMTRVLAFTSYYNEGKMSTSTNYLQPNRNNQTPNNEKEEKKNLDGCLNDFAR